MQVQTASGLLSTIGTARPASAAPVGTESKSREGLPAMAETMTTTIERRALRTEHATPVRLYMTSDLRAATGLTRTHLDFYLREGLIAPTSRTESGYLLFDEHELATLRQIIAWRQDGVGIREIRERLGR